MNGSKDLVWFKINQQDAIKNGKGTETIHKDSTGLEDPS